MLTLDDPGNPCINGVHARNEGELEDPNDTVNILK